MSTNSSFLCFYLCFTSLWTQCLWVLFWFLFKGWVKRFICYQNSWRVPDLLRQLYWHAHICFSGIWGENQNSFVIVISFLLQDFLMMKWIECFRICTTLTKYISIYLHTDNKIATTQHYTWNIVKQVELRQKSVKKKLRIDFHPLAKIPCVMSSKGTVNL